MDLVNQIAAQLGVDSSQASALAGAALGAVKDQVGEEAGAELDANVPELSGWQAQAQSALAGGGGMLGGLGGQLLGAVAGKEAQQAAQVVQLLSSFGLDAGKAALLGPIALGFLKTRMEPAWIDRALTLAPMLTGSEDASSAAMGAIGSLFGGGQ